MRARHLLPLLAAACVTKAWVPPAVDTDDGDVTGGQHHDTDPGDGDTDEGTADTAWDESGGSFETDAPPVDTEVVADTDAADTDAPPVDTDVPPVDTDLPSADTADTAVFGPPGPWRPDRFTYTAEFAVDATAAVTSFFRDGHEVQPYLEIDLNDGVDHCRIRYEVDPTAFDWYRASGQRTDTWDWIDWANPWYAVDFGFLVDEGGYVGKVLTGGRCDDLRSGYFAPSLFAWARKAGQRTSDATYVGAGPGPLTADATAKADADGVPAAKRLGAAFTFPFQFGAGAGANTLGSYAVWAHVDAGRAIEVDANGDPVLQDAAGASNAHDAPSVGWFRVVAAFDLTFTPP